MERQQHAYLRRPQVPAVTTTAACCTECGREYMDLAPAELARMEAGRGCPSDDCQHDERTETTGL